jgi:thiamine-monophosphate kinase
MGSGVSSEEERVLRLAARFGVAQPGVAMGIGDDAAVLEPPAGKRLVWTVDAQVEGVHFRREWLASLRDAGYRSFMAAASDVAAMGAEPWCALSGLELPAELGDDALDALTAGQRAAADELGTSIVGGNLSRGPALAITTTLLGTCEAPISRSGAQEGDGVWLAGPVGLAAAGLTALAAASTAPHLAAAIAAWRTPVARIRDGRALAGVAHAAIDVSDGLARDLGHVAAASGVRAVLDAELLLEHAGDTLARAAEAVGRAPLELLLYGGEDYALVAAAALPLPGFTRVGEIRRGAGLSLRTAGKETDLVPRGYDHFVTE